MQASDEMARSLLIEDWGIRRRLVINRPRKANALNDETLAALKLAVDAAAKDPNIRLIEITGTGERVFCAGADLTETSGQTADAQLAQAYDARWDRLTAAIEGLPCVTVAYLNGACIGGGLSLALACDFRIASTNAWFAYPAARHGFMPSPADVRRLVTLVGPAQARSILLLGLRKSAAEALRIGLIEALPADFPVSNVLTELIQAVETGKVNSQLAIKRLVASQGLSASIIRDSYGAVYDQDLQATERLRRAQTDCGCE